MQIGCLIWLVPILVLIGWAYWNETPLVILIGVLFSILVVKNIYDSYFRTKRLQAELTKFKNALILFYPTTKSKQEVIKEKLGKNIDPSIYQIYYNENELTGDLQSKIIISGGLSPINKYGSHHPRLIQIQGHNFVELLSLKQLIKINDMDQEQINTLIQQINNYTTTAS